MELFRLLGVIALSGDEEAKAKMDGVTNKAEKSSGKIGKAIKKMGKLAVGAVTAGATAAATLTKTAVDSFAEYEQLVGGSKLLYGDAYDFVEERAKKAYQNVQMSQNAYLEQMNGFATGLKTALGGDAQAAAELADKILTAEADIVAATGNSQEAVQNAFNGIMKSNFTMLDNLQLGITPTKEGFQQVIDKVNEWNAANGEATDYQIDNLADCQAALVKYVEMQGLAGYAANEASETISGSAATMKSAWENVLVGLADKKQNMDELLSKLGDSVLTFKDNIMPRVEQTLTGIGTLIEKVVPPIVAEIPKLITDTLPGLVTAGASIVSALAQSITSSLPMLLQIGIDLLLQFLDGFTQNIDSVLTTATEIIITLADGITSALPKLIPAAVGAIIAFGMALVNGENITALINSALALMEALADGLLVALPMLTEAVPTIITSLLTALLGNDNLSKIIETGITVNMALIDGLLSAIPDLIAAIPDIIFAIANTLMGYDWISLGKKMIESYIKGITSTQGKLAEIIKSILDANVKVFDGAYSKIDNLTGGALSKITGLWKNNLNLLSGLATSALNKVVDSFNSKMDRAKKVVDTGLQIIKNLFNFEFRIPNIKLPHFKISPSGWKFSDLLQGDIPTLGIDWYAKGGVLTQPTIFGMSGNTLLGGGEAGDEAVAPIDVLQGYVAEAVASQNAGLVAILEKILLAIIAMDENMGGNLKVALEDMSFELNKREFARLVKAVN